MKRLIRDPQFYRTFCLLTLSLALQNLLTYSVNLADNLMLGRYSQTAMSAVALCNQYQFFLQMLVVGVSEGVIVLGAQYWGQNRLEPIRDIIGVGLRFGLAISGLMFLLALLFPDAIIGIISTDRAITAEAVRYLRIICFTYVIFTVTHTLTVSLRSVGVVHIGYILSFSTLCLNMLLNFLLIYGNWGCPELGIRGAAIATLVSRSVELLIVLLYLRFGEHTLHLTLRSLLRIDRSYIRDYVRVAGPVVVGQTMWGLAQLIQTAIIGHLENASAAIAANAIAVLTFQIISVVGYGAASAAGILTGRAVGQGDMDLIHRQTFTLQWIFAGLGVVTGLAIYLACPLVLSFYPTLTEETKVITRQFILVLAVTTVGTCYQMAADNGIIRPGGSPAFSMNNNIIFMWGIAIPSALISAYVLHLPAVVVFSCLKSDQILKCFSIFWFTNSYRWVKNVTRPAT